MAARKLGWRPDERDERDHDARELFGLATAPDGLPLEASLREHCPPPFDQGSTNSCVAQAIALAVMILESRKGLPRTPPSRLFMYYNARRAFSPTAAILFDLGSSPRLAIKALAKLGAPDEDRWSFSTSSLRVNRRPSFEAYMRAHARRGGEYARIASQGADRVRDIKEAIAQGYPVIFGTHVAKSYLSSGGPGVVSRPSPTERLAGGHMQTIVGYALAAAGSVQFEVQNSWGGGWRDGGYCYLTEDYVTWAMTTDLYVVRGWDSIRPAAVTA